MQAIINKCFLLNSEEKEKKIAQLRLVIFEKIPTVSELNGFCVFLDNDKTDLRQLFFRD